MFKTTKLEIDATNSQSRTKEVKLKEQEVELNVLTRFKKVDLKICSEENLITLDDLMDVNQENRLGSRRDKR
jgi:hypothetical protein